VICYNNESDLIKYAKNLKHQVISSEILLVIVVTKNENFLLKYIESILIEININYLLLESKIDLGYFKGFMFGYEKCKEIYGDKTLFYILSNTDIEFKDQKFFETLVNNSYEDDIYAIGPSIYSPYNKKFQNPVRLHKRKSFKLFILLTIFKFKFLSKIYFWLSNNKKREEKETNMSQVCYEIHGSFMIFIPKMLKVFEDNYFEPYLFSEEWYVSELLTEINKKAFFDKSLRIIHNEHSTTSLKGYKIKSKLYYDSLLFIKKRFYFKKG
jgi:hypothetical protein